VGVARGRNAFYHSNTTVRNILNVGGNTANPNHGALQRWQTAVMLVAKENGGIAVLIARLTEKIITISVISIYIYT
jgi:hypothetical protein